MRIVISQTAEDLGRRAAAESARIISEAMATNATDGRNRTIMLTIFVQNRFISFTNCRTMPS